MHLRLVTAAAAVAKREQHLGWSDLPTRVGDHHHLCSTPLVSGLLPIRLLSTCHLFRIPHGARATEPKVGLLPIVETKQTLATAVPHQQALLFDFAPRANGQHHDTSRKSIAALCLFCCFPTFPLLHTALYIHTHTHHAERSMTLEAVLLGSTTAIGKSELHLTFTHNIST